MRRIESRRLLPLVERDLHTLAPRLVLNQTVVERFSKGRGRWAATATDISECPEHGERTSALPDVDDGGREFLRGLLRHVVTNAGQDAVRVCTRELFAVRHAVRRCAVEITSDRDRGHANDGHGEEPL